MYSDPTIAYLNEAPRISFPKDKTAKKKKARTSRPAKDLNILTFDELIEEASVQIEDESFDSDLILSHLGRFKRVPEEASDLTIEKLYTVLYECIPEEDYDLDDS